MRQHNDASDYRAQVACCLPWGRRAGVRDQHGPNNVSPKQQESSAVSSVALQQNTNPAGDGAVAPMAMPPAFLGMAARLGLGLRLPQQHQQQHFGLGGTSSLKGLLPEVLLKDLDLRLSRLARPAVVLAIEIWDGDDDACSPGNSQQHGDSATEVVLNIPSPGSSTFESAGPAACGEVRTQPPTLHSRAVCCTIQPR